MSMHVSSNSFLLVCRDMTRRNDREIIDDLESVAQALQGQQNHQGANDELYGLEKFKETIFRLSRAYMIRRFDTHMLSEEGEDWWDNARQRLEALDTEITWVVFGAYFLENYFPEDVRSKKEVKFLELKQWNMSVVEYATKFKEMGIGYQEIHQFPMLVNKCKIYNDESMDRSAHYKSLSERKGKKWYRMKLYSAPAEKGKQRVLDEKRPTRGETHIARVMGRIVITAANRVILVLAIRNQRSISLIAIIDTSAVYSFILFDCAERLGLKLYVMGGSMVINTPTNGSVTTSWVCLNCPLTIYGKSFGMDLVCLPLNQIDVILGMNWLEFNHVQINCFDKSLSFPKFDASDELFVSAKQVDEFMKDDVEVFMIIASMNAGNKVGID
ncbi:uncharacterized protein LOC127089884 [Lathyrus oleraceus]|uniref:uncharacterized protein LOC127089884 n=1 Tax=Pisum sativum TaxID=3888 RepID=UPI0021CEF843|nr:uncharacterized protein LOC127089884 [Pisum sativum]